MSDRGPTPTVPGREREFERLRTSIAAVAAGRGGSVWVSGEPGIGKSTLVRAAVAVARERGCQVFTARADEFDDLFPLRTVLAALGVAPGSSDPARARLAELVWPARPVAMATTGDTTALGAASELILSLVDEWCVAAPVVLAVDDMQWADGMSLAVWGELHRSVGQLPLLLVAAARPVPARPDLDRLRRAAAEVTVGPLSDADVDRLVVRRLGTGPDAALRARTREAGGNPLHVTELVDAAVRGGTGARPDSLAAAIDARLGLLSARALDVLRTAALLGVTVDADRLGPATGTPADDLTDLIREAIAAGVLVGTGTDPGFRHPLIRAALIRSGPERAVRHQRLATALARSGAPAEDVARHLNASPAEPAPWVVDWADVHAPALIDRVPQLAADLLRRLHDEVDPGEPRRDRLGTHLAAVLARLGRYEEVEALARPVLTRSLDPATTGPMAWTLALALMRLTRYRDALVVTARAVRQEPRDPVWVARLRAVRALVLAVSGRYRQAETVAARAEAEGTTVGDPVAVGYALHARALWLRRRGRDPAAFLATVERALATIGSRPETTDLRLLLLGDRAMVLASVGRLEEADRALGEAVAQAERAGSPSARSRAHVQAAELSFALGRWDRTRAEVEVAADLPTGEGHRARLRGLAALVAVHRDEREEANRRLTDVDELLGNGDVRDDLDHLLLARAVATERDLGPRAALRQLLDVYDPDGSTRFTGMTTEAQFWLPEVARLAIAANDRPSAGAATRVISDRAAQSPQPPTVAAARHAAGLVGGDPDALLAAAELYRDAGFRFRQGRALEDAAVAAAELGDVATAHMAYTGAVDIYAGLGAAYDLRRADARLQPLGVRRGARGPRRRPDTGRPALTPTESTIVDLVASGRSNTDIAARLRLSRRTVRHHVARILVTLNAKSRVDIARYAAGPRM